ncbi:hypothetical protein [Actinoplanes sp. URMC 104]|uniref:hypothetical protein n=1 Tax=Actinoplanes sp. URMC 104 TaxID=3423409 RepID=UPI003F1D0EE3
MRLPRHTATATAAAALLTLAGCSNATSIEPAAAPVVSAPPAGQASADATASPDPRRFKGMPPAETPPAAGAQRTAVPAAKLTRARACTLISEAASDWQTIAMRHKLDPELTSNVIKPGEVQRLSTTIKQLRPHLPAADAARADQLTGPLDVMYAVLLGTELVPVDLTPGQAAATHLQDQPCR